MTTTHPPADEAAHLAREMNRLCDALVALAAGDSAPAQTKPFAALAAAAKVADVAAEASPLLAVRLARGFVAVAQGLCPAVVTVVDVPPSGRAH